MEVMAWWSCLRRVVRVVVGEVARERSMMGMLVKEDDIVW